MEKIDFKNEFITYHLNRNHSPRTLEIYEKILKKFLAKVGPAPLHHPRPLRIRHRPDTLSTQ